MGFVQQTLKQKEWSSLGGLEPPTFRLTAERANRLRHRDSWDLLEQHQKSDCTLHLLIFIED